MGPHEPKSAKGGEYKVRFKSDNWVERVEIALTMSGLMMVAFSFPIVFAKNFEDQDLDKLALKTFNMIDDLDVEKKDYTTFNNREAYRLKVKVK